MESWVGPVGALIPFHAPSSVESETADPHVYFRPLGGDVHVTRLGDPMRPRVWQVGISAAYPSEVATLEALSSGAWGIGPFVFIPPAAETVNLLGRRDSLCHGDPGDGYALSTPSTPVLTTEGYAGSSYVTTSATPPVRTMGTAPVIPGKPVTGKAWVQALTGTTATLDLAFYDTNDTRISSSSAAATTSTAGEYLTVTETAPEGAAKVRLRCAGATIAHPQVTWTATARTWAPSKASMNTVVSPLTDSVRLAFGTPGSEQITDHSFTVTELTA